MALTTLKLASLFLHFSSMTCWIKEALSSIQIRLQTAHATEPTKLDTSCLNQQME